MVSDIVSSATSTDWGMVITIVISFIGMIFGVAALLAGIGYLRQGKNQGKLDANNLLQQDVSELTKRINNQDTEIKRLTEEVKSLHDAIDIRDKRFAESILLLQGKDPQLVAFVAIVQKYIESNIPLLNTINTETIPTIKRLEKFLDKQSI